jgi:hypothetical protein
MRSRDPSACGIFAEAARLPADVRFSSSRGRIKTSTALTNKVGQIIGDMHN